MSQVVTLCRAPNYFITEALRGALAEAGIGCVVRSNEIPMEPGFNFGAAYHCADLLVLEAELPRAREVLAELAVVLCGESHDCETVYPPRINLRSTRWIVQFVVIGWLALIAVTTLVDASGTVLGAWLFLAFFLLVIGFVPLGVALILILFNWPQAVRTTQAIAVSLLALVVVPLWLVAALARWLLALILRLPKLLAARW